MRVNQGASKSNVRSRPESKPVFIPKILEPETTLFLRKKRETNWKWNFETKKTYWTQCEIRQGWLLLAQ